MYELHSVEANQASRPLMSEPYDIVLESPRRERILIVECGGPNGFTRQDAARLRERLLEYWALEARFFMLAFGTELFLWKRESEPGALPDFTSSARSVLRDYLGRVMDDPHEPSLFSIEITMGSWLHDLAWGMRKLQAGSEADQMLVHSGLYAQMKHASVRTDV
jgi:hypothetical protein